MKEHIEREAAILALLDKGQRSKRYHLGDVWELNFDEIKEAIASIPAADVRPVVRGEWRKIGKTGCIFVCSACDKTFPCKTHYCPNCGADMRRES